MSQEQNQGITDNQLFQQFTKSSQVCTNSFQLLFDTATRLQIDNTQLQKENAFLVNLCKANSIEIPKMPIPEGTMIANTKPPNRAERRAIDKKQKKSK